MLTMQNFLPQGEFNYSNRMKSPFGKEDGLVPDLMPYNLDLPCNFHLLREPIIIYPVWKKVTLSLFQKYSTVYYIVGLIMRDVKFSSRLPYLSWDLPNEHNLINFLPKYQYLSKFPLLGEALECFVEEDYHSKNPSRSSPFVHYLPPKRCMNLLIFYKKLGNSKWPNLLEGQQLWKSLQGHCYLDTFPALSDTT